MDYRSKYKFIRNVNIITSIMLILSLIGNFYKYETRVNSNFTQINSYNKNLKFEDSLINFINLLEIKHPKIVYNQAKLETGNFISNKFKKYNALFGFQISDTNIIKYKSWKESVIDYKAWQMKRLKNNENYYDFLVRIKYANDSNYINKLKQF